jgi:hypothetical protein
MSSGPGASPRVSNAWGRCKAIELRAEPLDIEWVGHHALDRPLEGLGQGRQPAADVGLGTGNDDGALFFTHRQNAVALGVRPRQQSGEPVDIDMEWVNAPVGLASFERQPQGQGFQIESLGRTALVIQAQLVQIDQRVQFAGRDGRAQSSLGIVLGNQALNP